MLTIDLKFYFGRNLISQFLIVFPWVRELILVGRISPSTKKMKICKLFSHCMEMACLKQTHCKLWMAELIKAKVKQLFWQFHESCWWSYCNNINFLHHTILYRMVYNGVQPCYHNNQKIIFQSTPSLFFSACSSSIDFLRKSIKIGVLL